MLRRSRCVLIFLETTTNSVLHVVECPCALVVRCKCISLYQLQFCSIACVLDYKPLLYKGRGHHYYWYVIINLFFYVLIKIPNEWRTIKSLVHKIRLLHGRRRKERAESFSREKLRHADRRRKVDETSCVTFLLCDPGWYAQRT